MSIGTRHTLWLRCMAAALLCVVLYCVDARTTEGTTTVYGAYDTPRTSLDVEAYATLDTVHDMAQWLLPTTSASLQGTMRRTLISGQTVQRLMRSCGIPLTGEPLSMQSQIEVLHRATSAKRFHTGYYIYFRCQMRC